MIVVSVGYVDKGLLSGDTQKAYRRSDINANIPAAYCELCALKRALLMDRQSNLKTIFDEAAIGQVAKSINPNAASDKVTEPEIRALFYSLGLVFTNEEIDTISRYYSAGVGIKDRQLAQNFAARFASGSDIQRKSIANTQSTSPKLRQLVDLFDVPKFVNGSRAPLPLNSAELEAILISIYGSLSEPEMDEMIRFYSSSIGKKLAEATHGAAAKLLSHRVGQNSEDK
jgi:hypothetical protein